jgi:hypothetical protein
VASKLRMKIAADPSADFARVTAKLKAAGRGDLQRNMVAKIRRRGQPAVTAARAAIRQATLPALPAKGGGASSGLRDRAAAAIGMTATPTGVSIRVDGKKVDPAYGMTMFLALNGLTKLRHPVFGNRSAWVRQQGGSERFFSALKPFSEQWRRDVEQVLDDYAREIGA